MNKFKPSWVIAKNTYKEIIRDKLLYGIFFIAVLVTTSSFFLATISLEQNARVLENIGLEAINLFTLFICVFVATNSMYKDIDRRAFYLLFSKPINRGQYILGKFGGSMLLLATSLLILTGLFSLGSWFIDKSVVTAALINLGYAFMEIGLISALAIMFSCFTAPLNAALYSLAIYIIGHSLDLLRKFVESMDSRILHGVVNFFYYLLPNLEKFNVRGSVLYGIAIPPAHILWSIVYFLVYTSAVLALAVTIINKREV